MIDYPIARRVDVVDDYHGTKVADPFRWLEQQDSAEVSAYVDEQNALSRSLLDGLPERAWFAERLASLLKAPSRQVPRFGGGRRFELRHDGEQQQPALWVVEPDGDERVLIDPNAIRPDGTLALMSVSPRPDGRLVAWSSTEGGSDWQTIRFRDVDTGTDLPDELSWIKLPWAAWDPSGEVFYYVGTEDPGEVDPETALTARMRVQEHRLGTPQSADSVLVAHPAAHWCAPYVDLQLNALVVEVYEGHVPKRILIRRFGEDEFTELLTGDEAQRYAGSFDGRLVVHSHVDAAAGRVLLVDPTGEKAPRVVLAEDPALPLSAVGGVKVVGRHLVSVHTDVSRHLVRVTALDSGEQWTVDLPGPGALGTGGSDFIGLEPNADDSGFLAKFSSYVTPPTIIEHTFADRTTRIAWTPELEGYDPERFVIEDVRVASTDGALVPLTIVRRSDVGLPGSALLTGYGGFGLVFSLLGFDPAHAAWLEAGGILACASLRGGGEFGEDWHRAGMLESKQHVFDDLHACATYLIAEGWASVGRVGINGASNGGLLVGAALVQRPELYGAAVPEVGLLDMLRYHRFTVAQAWIPEYGSADDPGQFGFIAAYSPLHNVKPGTRYPPTLITTGDHDTRCPPGPHSYKFAATLQAAQAGAAPILLSVSRQSGHGFGKSLAKQIDERADVLAFLAHHTKLRL